MSWPVAGGRERYPVYRDEQGHINSGQGAAWDLCNEFLVAWVAPANGIVVTGTGRDPFKDDSAFHAGNVVVYQFGWNGGTYRAHFCHGAELEVSVGQQFKQGNWIGHVGYTGTFFDAQGRQAPGTEALAHLHLWCEKWDTDRWVRVPPSELWG